MSVRHSRVGPDDVLVLDDPNPGRALTIARAQPYVVDVREADLDGEMGAKTLRVGMFLVEPVAEFAKTCLGLFVRNRPFGRELWVL